MKKRVAIFISVPLLICGLAIASEQSTVVTIKLTEDQIAKIITSPGIVSRISFPDEVKEVICGDLYDPASGTGSFVIQRSGTDVFVKPVVAKGMSNLFVKVGDEGETTYGLDLEIGSPSQAQRVVNIVDARPVAARNKVSRPRRIGTLRPPVTSPITSSSFTALNLPGWVSSILGLSNSPIPEPPAIEYKPAVQVRRQAVRRVAPEYPEIARRVGAQGEVVVEVTISAEGKVTSAKAVSGHLLLRNSAIQAAKLWRFTSVPAGEGEEQSAARITFNFQSSYTLSGSYFYSIGGGTSSVERRQ